MLVIMSFVCLQPSECHIITCSWRPYSHSSLDLTSTRNQPLPTFLFLGACLLQGR